MQHNQAGSRMCKSAHHPRTPPAARGFDIRDTVWSQFTRLGVRSRSWQSQDPRRPRTRSPSTSSRPSSRAAARSSRSSEAEAVVWAGPEDRARRAARPGQVGAAAVRRDRAVGRAHPRHARRAVHQSPSAPTRRRSPSTPWRCCSPARAGSTSTPARTTWDPEDERVLEGSTVAIIGAGGIGRELIKMLEPHDVEIIAVTRCGRDGTLSVDQLPEVWGTGRPFRHRRARDRRHASTSSGATELAADEAALLDREHRPRVADRQRRARSRRSTQRRLGGAALDVTDPEPLPDDHPLWTNPRVLITPHVANPPNTMARDLAKRVRGERAPLRRRRGAAGSGQPGSGLLKRSRAASISATATSRSAKPWISTSLPSGCL